MLPVGNSKNYCRSYEFRQIFSPLNNGIVKTSKILLRFLKFKLLKLISTTTVFLVIVMLKLTQFHGIKGNNSVQLQHFFDNHLVFGCKSIEY